MSADIFISSKGHTRPLKIHAQFITVVYQTIAP